MILSLRLEQCKKENKLPTFTNTYTTREWKAKVENHSRYK